MDPVGWLFVIFVGLYILLAALVGRAAGKKGKHAGQWFVLAVLITPLFSAILLALSAPKVRESNPAIASRCGKCGKALSPVWKSKCNHCGAKFADYPPVIATTA